MDLLFGGKAREVFHSNFFLDLHSTRTRDAESFISHVVITRRHRSEQQVVLRARIDTCFQVEAFQGKQGNFMAPEGVTEDETEQDRITRALWHVWSVVLQSVYLLCGRVSGGHTGRPNAIAQAYRYIPRGAQRPARHDRRARSLSAGGAAPHRRQAKGG